MVEGGGGAAAADPLCVAVSNPFHGSSLVEISGGRLLPRTAPCPPLHVPLVESSASLRAVVVIMHIRFRSTVVLDSGLPERCGELHSTVVSV